MTASIESKPASTKSSSRRALLAGALGGIGAVAAGAMAKVSPVRAEGEAMVVGGDYATATSLTSLINGANNADVFQARSMAAGDAVVAGSNTGRGVYGTSSTDAGVYGYSISGTGVRGNSDSSHGVVGTNSAAELAAVLGYAAGNGTGVSGSSGAAPPPSPRPGSTATPTRTRAAKACGATRGAGWGSTPRPTRPATPCGRMAGSRPARCRGSRPSAPGLTSVTLNPGVKVSNASFVLLTPGQNRFSGAVVHHQPERWHHHHPPQLVPLIEHQDRLAAAGVSGCRTGQLQ